MTQLILINKGKGTPAMPLDEVTRLMDAMQAMMQFIASVKIYNVLRAVNMLIKEIPNTVLLWNFRPSKTVPSIRVQFGMEAFN